MTYFLTTIGYRLHDFEIFPTTIDYKLHDVATLYLHDLATMKLYYVVCIYIVATSCRLHVSA